MALLAGVLLSCAPPARDSDDPVAVARGFLRAVKADRCDEAFAYFSSPTMARIGEMTRRHEHAPNDFMPGLFTREMFCQPDAENHFDSYSTRHLKLLARDGATARVGTTIAMPKDGIVPGLTWGTRDEPAELSLVREDGAWRIDLKLTDPTPGYDEIEVGRFVVAVPDTRAGATTFVRAEGTLAARPEKVMEAFEDIGRWPSFWPSVQATRRLEAADRDGRPLWHVVFASADERVEAVVTQPSCSTGSQGRFSCGIGFRPHPLPGAALQVTERGGGIHGERPAKDIPDRTLVSWNLTFANIAWPDGIRAALLEPKGVAATLDALEQEARRRDADTPSTR